MCGELDDNVQIGLDLLDRLRVMAKMLNVEPDETERQGGRPTGLAEASGRASYMDSLFTAGLTRALHDTAAADSDEAVDAIASQAIAFARLAGFLAGQLPPEADLFRASMEAMIAGHSETGRLAKSYRQHHENMHGHSHDDDHHHH
jgi:hypothetical protein